MAHKTWFFPHAGKENTDAVLRLVAARARELGIQKVLVPSATGTTALAAAEALTGLRVVVITQQAGSVKPTPQGFPLEARRALKAKGIAVHPVTHVFGGFVRAIRKTFGAHVIGDLVANPLCVFGPGLKVAVEITLMAADCGAVRANEPVIAMGGAYNGVDTAIVCKPVKEKRILDLKIHEILCKPHFQA